jgi:hypothetical protein
VVCLLVSLVVSTFFAHHNYSESMRAPRETVQSVPESVDLGAGPPPLRYPSVVTDSWADNIPGALSPHGFRPPLHCTRRPPPMNWQTQGSVYLQEASGGFNNNVRSLANALEIAYRLRRVLVLDDFYYALVLAVFDVSWLLQWYTVVPWNGGYEKDALIFTGKTMFWCFLVTTLTHTCVHTYKHRHTDTHTHTHTHLYIHIYTHIHTCTYTRTCTHMHTRTYTAVWRKRPSGQV